MSGFRPIPSGGTVRQAGIPKRGSRRARRANGLLLQGVVVRSYLYGENLNYSASTASPIPANAIRVDVQCYGRRQDFIPRVRWTYPNSGHQEGDIILPRVATQTVDGSPLDIAKGTNMALANGDHVIIGFLEDDLHRPVIVRHLPHPSSDTGNADREAGFRQRVTASDGHPRYQKHRGAFFGVDDSGNWILDLRRAHEGAINDDGTEPDPALSGASGNVRVKIPENSKVEFELTVGTQEGDGSDSSASSTIVRFENNKVTVQNAGGEALTLEGADAAATMKLGVGDVGAAIGEALQTWWDGNVQPALAALEAQFLLHVHLSAAPSNPTGPQIAPTPVPPTPASTIPPFDAATIISNALKIPKN